MKFPRILFPTVFYILSGLLVLQLQAADSLAQQIIDRAIEVHGGEKYQSSRIEFDFRNRHYAAERLGEFFLMKDPFRIAAAM